MKSSDTELIWSFSINQGSINLDDVRFVREIGFRMTRPLDSRQ